jgi:hypothetical protein
MLILNPPTSSWWLAAQWILVIPTANGARAFTEKMEYRRMRAFAATGQAGFVTVLSLKA